MLASLLLESMPSHKRSEVHMNTHLKDYVHSIIHSEPSLGRASAKCGIHKSTLHRLQNEAEYLTPGIHVLARLAPLGLDPETAFKCAEMDNEGENP
jgi:hypothetical protein